MCETFAVASFNDRKNSPISSDDSARCGNDGFYCHLLELKDHLWLKEVAGTRQTKKALLLHRCIFTLCSEKHYSDFPPNT